MKVVQVLRSTQLLASY